VSEETTQDAFASLGGRLDPATITVVGPYKGLRYFAAGGMAWLYEARHPQFPEKRLAVKLMKPEFAAMPAMRERFLREAQLLARVGHPHLVSVHSFGLDEATRCPYFAMDYIDGGTLADRLEAEGSLPVAAAAELFDRVLGALSALHREGVIHRDIKPSNILLWRSGEPMLADLGIARDTLALGASTTQHFIGSPKYSSPEQAHGMRLDPRTDVFSLGLSLFETLVGYHPYEDAKNVDTSSAASLIGLLALLYRDKQPIPLEFTREIPKAVRAVIRTAVEIPPERRFADADEMRRALRDAMRSADADGRESALGRSFAAGLGWLRAKGLRLALGAGALAVLATLVAGGYAGWSAYQRELARAELVRARRAVTALAPSDTALAGQLGEASALIDRNEPEAAIAAATRLCSELGQRFAASLDGPLADSATALQRAKFTVQHAQVGGDAWGALDALARDESRRAPHGSGEAACDSPLRLGEYAGALRDANGALAAALAGPELRKQVDEVRERGHGAALAPLVDAKTLADADTAYAAGDLPRAYELYLHADLSARAAELSQRLAPRLRDLSAAPEFAERRAAVSSALTRIVKLGTSTDPDALAAELEPAEAEARAALAGARSDVDAALAAAEQELAHARESGVAKAAIARGETQLAGARAAAEQERLVAAAVAAKSVQEESARQAKIVTEGAGAARGAREAALAARAQAVAAGAPERALAKGDDLVEKSDQRIAEGDPVRAVDGFGGAQKSFEAARDAAVETATRAADKARSAAAQARQRAVELGAAAEDLAPAEKAEQLAEQALAGGQPGEALARFGSAREVYERAPLRGAEERAAAARASALASGATAEALAKGDAALAQARDAKRTDEALRLLAAAEHAFGAAGVEAGKSAALAKRQLALSAQGRAVRAQAIQAELSAGRTALQEGDAALAAGDLATAAQRFTDASARFDEAEQAARSRTGGAAPQ
jgi:protein kinase-like protein